MRGTRLAKAHMMLELDRLLRIHKRPAWAPDDMHAFAGDYIAICDDVSAEQMTQGVTAYLKSPARFFPKPGELRAIAREQRGLQPADADPDSYNDWVARGFVDPKTSRFQPCPACGRAWQAQPRITIVHRHGRHRELGLPCLFSCDEPNCIGTYGVPQKVAPAALSEGEVWVAPDGWTNGLGRIRDRGAVTP